MIREDVVRELREMFLDGASPSRLMLHIQTRHPDDDQLHFLIMDYFQEAFNIPLVRVMPNTDYSIGGGEQFHFNRDLVHEIVCQIDQWNSGDTVGTWLDDLSEMAHKTLREHRERLSASRFDALDRVWDDLTESERNFIISRIANKDFLWYKVNTLSRLVERLQQKIVELEKQVELEANEAANS